MGSFWELSDRFLLLGVLILCAPCFLLFCARAATDVSSDSVACLMSELMPTSEASSHNSPLHLRPELGDLDVLTRYVEQFGERNGWAAADTHAFSLAAEELFANTLRHSQPAASLIEFSIEANGSSATARYSDDGGEFDPTALPEVDTTLPLAQRPIGGLGIHFIRKTMQTFLYRREGERNVIEFGRTLKPATEVGQSAS